jgi:ABC-type uncharacterized transport system permease subunit
MVESLPYLARALLYGALAFYFWRTRWGPAAANNAAPGDDARWIEHYLVLAPLALHAALLGRAAFAPDGLHLGVGNAVSAILWLTVLIYWLGNFFYRLDGLQTLVLPVAAVAALLPAVFPSVKPLPNTELAAFKAHLLVAMAAYSLLTIASLHVLLMTLIERRLHEGVLPQRLRNLPPLLTMAKLLFQIIWAGFILLTLTIASGVIYSEELFGKAARFNHKPCSACSSWISFAAPPLRQACASLRLARTLAVRWTLARISRIVLLLRSSGAWDSC